MAKRAARFAVGHADGVRSSEWVAWWTTTTSDVYLAVRTLGGSLKASLHESGVCHFRAPDARKWRSPGEPPKFLDSWNIDPQSAYEFPFRVIIPPTELRAGPWATHRDKETIWLPPTGAAVELGVFLTRNVQSAQERFTAAGWHTVIASDMLPDGRNLWVLADNGNVTPKKQQELEIVKGNLRKLVSPDQGNCRILLVFRDDSGTRGFVEAAL